MREFFTRLRNSVRSFLQRLQRRATAKAGGSQAVPATPGIPASHPSHGTIWQISLLCDLSTGAQNPLRQDG